MNILQTLLANWQAPHNIKALTTTRKEGFSLTPYSENNLGLHVGDKAEHVLANRASLKQKLQLPNEPEWLSQIHSDICVIIGEDNNREADAAISKSKDKVLAIMTADCLPIVLCNKEGTEIAAIHAGWKGLANGVIENTLTKMTSPAKDLIAWIGPSICQSCFEVGGEVFDIFKSRFSFAEKHFSARNEKWLANLPGLAESRLYQLGLSAVYQSKICTFEEENDFYSYRRQAQTGRMVTLIWFNENN